MTTGSTRRLARERALELLYEADLKDEPVADVIAALPVRPDEFAVAVVEGAHAQRERIDGLISRFSKGWELGRMPSTDRAILRMATYELCERPEIPTGVVISEAVELAGEYSTDESSRFVNGLLARIAVEVRE